MERLNQARFKPSIWLARNAQVAISSLGKLWQRPLGTLMTVLMIGIAIALPVGLHLMVKNLQQLSSNWGGAATVSLFLQPELKNGQVRQVITTLVDHPAVDEVQHITPQQAMAEFAQHSGFGAAIELLDETPLPHLALIYLKDPRLPSAELQQLLGELQNLPGVEQALADLQWVARFQAITLILQRGALVLALLLAAAVLLVIGNTIRLDIQARRDEIEITRLVGGTNTFIHRPFLYEGFWYGLLGGATAVLLVSLSSWSLQQPVAHLSELYGSNFSLTGLTLLQVIPVILSSSGLGALGAWIAVRQHLGALEPN